MDIDESLGVECYDSDGNLGIKLKNGHQPEILDALADAIKNYLDENPVMFFRAGRVVVVHFINSKASDFNTRERVLIIPVDAAHFIEIVGRFVKFFKYDMRVTDPDTGKKGTWVSCDCPRRIAEAYLSRGYHSEIPVLNGFCECPTIFGQKVLDQPGYDKNSGLYMALSKEFLPGYDSVPYCPSKEQAIESLAILKEALGGFPYVSDADFCGMIAAILTAIIRRILDSAPLFGISSPLPGTGKTLLADTLALILMARRASVISLGHDEAETEKRLIAALLAGDSLIPIDNVGDGRPLSGDVLCQATTQPSMRARPLGFSSLVSVPTNALLVGTGNNLLIKGDLKRRIVSIRLDAKTERPEQRAIPRNHLDYILSIRGKIIKAALTIIKAYLMKGEPTIEGHIPFGSFDEWDRLVRRPLLWLGCPDPLQTAEALRDNDPDIEAMRAIFHAWSEITELSGACTAPEIIKIGNSYLIGGEPSYPDMRDALQLICSEKITARRVGNWLKSHRDRIVDGIQLQQSGKTRTNLAKWRIVKCDS